MTAHVSSLRAKRSNLAGTAELALAWPVDLGLTVASHGWVHLEPWRWEPETGTLSRAERIDNVVGTLAVAQSSSKSIDISWDGFEFATSIREILRRAGRWVSAEWSPAA